MLKSFKKSLHLAVALICSITLFLAGAFIAPHPITAVADESFTPEGFTKVSFSSVGIDNGTYGYNNNKVAVSGTLDGSFDKKYFSGNIKLSGSAATLYIAGTADAKGLGVLANATQLIFTLDGTKILGVTAAQAGLSKTRDVDFNLGVSFEISGNDLKVGIYINGVLMGGSIINCAGGKTKLGNVVSIKSTNSTGSVTVANDGNAQFLPDTSLDWITASDFYVGDGEYGYSGGNVAVKGSRIIGLGGTHFTADVKFSATEGATLRYAGAEKDGGMTGLIFGLSGGKLVLRDGFGGSDSTVQFESSVAKVDFTDFFNLGISIQIKDTDSDGAEDDVELGVWFNNILYNNEFINLTDFASYIKPDTSGNFANTLAVYSDVNGSTVTIASNPALVHDLPNKDLKRITFDHFGIAEGFYNSPGLTAGSYSGSLDGTYFSGEVTFAGTTQFNFGRRDDWASLLFTINNGKLTLDHNMHLFVPITFDLSKTGLNSFTETFRLGISTEFLDNDSDGEKDDVKLGIYFNEKLYDFFTFNDYLPYMTNSIAIYNDGGASTLKVGNIAEFIDPITSRPLDSSFKKFTFETISIVDKKYTSDDIIVSGSYSGDFDGSVFGGKVTFSPAPNGASSQIIYGANSGNAGMTINVAEDGRLVLGHNAVAFPVQYFLPSKAGLESFVDQPFDLWISTRYVDADGDGAKDDVELGMWFNGILYTDSFITLTDYVQYMDKYVYLYCPADTSITVGSLSDFVPVVIPEKLDSNLKTITLNNFSIPDNIYKDTNGAEPNGLAASGNYLKTLDNTYFAFYGNFSIPDPAAPISFQYAGAGDGWAGMTLEVYPDKLSFRDNVGRSDSYTFTASRANIDSFTGKDIKLGISTKYLDLDGDGAEDDVRFGVWVNDYLANNEYVDVIDYRQYIGNKDMGIGAGLGIYITPSATNNTVVAKLWSIEIPVKFEQFGFTSNWARELDLFAGSTSHGTAKNGGYTTTSPLTGEAADTLKAMIVSCVALGGIINIGNKRKIK